MERPKGAAGRPAEDDEIGFILRRCLFAEVDGLGEVAASLDLRLAEPALGRRQAQSLRRYDGALR